MKIKEVPIGKVKAGPDDGLEEGEFVVYPSTFTREPDAYGDVVAPGAFLKSLEAWQESGNIMSGLYGHRMDDPDYNVAEAIEMAEDEHGWRVKGRFDLESPKAAQVYRLVKGRRLNQLSFAYDTIDEGQVELDDGRKANELRELEVYEFSFVPVGANQDTSVVAVKSIVDGLKAGRPLSAKNEQSLRDARDAIDAVLASLGDSEDGDKAAHSGGAKSQGNQASGTSDANADASAEEPFVANASVSAEEQKSAPSVSDLAAKLRIYALMGQEERV